jgi:predicted MFS family arabinose efflux permease
MPTKTVPTPPTAAVSPQLRRSRFAVSGVFAAVGFVMATWLVNIPAVQARAGISHATLGFLLLMLGAGGVLAMQVCGVLSARFGSRAVLLGAFALDVVAINLPAHAPNTIALGIAMFLFGVGNGSADVSMNDQAVLVERRYPRPIMSAFHAMWSIGGAAGALTGAAVQRMQFDVGWSILTGSVIGAVLGAIAIPLLPRRPRTDTATPAETTDTTSVPAVWRLSNRERTQKIIIFGLLAFLLMLSEGVVSDWSALHAIEHLGQTESAASLAYGFFAVAMTVARLSVDRVAHRFGPVFVVRFGSLTAAVGVALVIVSPTYPVTLLGWVIFGIGLAGVVPQLFTAAGNLDPGHSSVTLSRVVGIGYTGILAGPAIIGALAGPMGLNQTFILPVVFCLLGVILSGRLRNS